MMLFLTRVKLDSLVLLLLDWLVDVAADARRLERLPQGSRRFERCID